MPFLFNKKRFTVLGVAFGLIANCLLLMGCYPDFSAVEKTENTSSSSSNALFKPLEFLRTSSSRALDSAVSGNFKSTVQLPVSKNYGNLPLIFEANQGQSDPRVKFTSRGNGYNFFLTPTETVLVLNKVASNNKLKKEVSQSENKNASISKSVVRMQFAGSSKKSKATGVDEQSGKSNYFIGSDSSKWRTNVQQFGKIKQEEVYPGIDILYYGNQNQLEYDIIVKAGAEPKNIKLKFKGTQTNHVNEDGDLILQTEIGELKQSKPIAYQQINGQKTSVECRYNLLGKNQVGFEIGEYDPNEPLIIDPVIDYSTFIGGTGADYVNDITVDSSGNAYITGSTNSTNFPTTTGTFRTVNSGADDVFVSKLNPTGTGLVYSTYIGGVGDRNNSGSDAGNSIAIDAAGNAYVSGTTASANFPVLNARQPSYGGGGDAFVLKLNTSGNALLFSTYHGGSGGDSSSAMAIDSAGNAYLTGNTNSTNFPVLNAFQATVKQSTNGSGPTTDVFVSKLSSTGATLVYSTYLGGSGNENGNGIAVDAQGSAYITGDVSAKDFPVVNAIQPTIRENDIDAFVTKLNTSGNALVYSTYLGGRTPDWTPCYPYCLLFSHDKGNDITVDSAGNAYIVGETLAMDFPTVNALQPYNASSSYQNQLEDVFVTEINSTGDNFVFSTYLGGSGVDKGLGVTLDSANNIYITGSTDSLNFPLAAPFKPQKNGQDAFVSKITSGGTSLEYSTYLGGVNADVGSAVAVDSTGNAYVAGNTTSTNFPTTASFQSTNKGDSEGFVTKISSSIGYDISGRIVKPDGSGAANVTVSLSGGLNYSTVTDSNGNYTFSSLAPNRNYTISPSSTVYSFQPANQTINNLSGNQTAVNFTINVYTISGRVTGVNGGIGSVTIALSGSETRTTKTDASGNYSFINLPGGSYTLSPSKTDPILTYSFTPSSRSFSNILADQIADFTAVTSITTELSAVADAYVQDGTSANTNFGAATNLKIQTNSKADNGLNFDSYLKFDLSSINRTIQTVKLRIPAASSTTGSVTTSAYPVSATNWVETGTGAINWTNKPARGATALASLTVAGTTFADYDIDLTNYIKSEKAAGRNIVSLALHNATASTVFINANSRENAGGKPRLIVTTGGSDNIAPAVTMTGPANGATYTAPATVTVSAAATDADGAISRVDFYNGTNLIGSAAVATGSTYSINWSNVPAGGYVLSAIAFDNNGAQTIASPVNVTVGSANASPTVSLTNPSNNSVFAVGSSINLSAAASDPDGTVSKVEFFVGSTLVGTAATPGTGGVYSAVWNNATTGNYAVTAKATDNAGGVATSAAVPVNVVGQTGISPAADSYVQDGSSATTNFGTATDLRAQISATAGANRETYLKFDTTSITGVAKATLRMYGRLSDATGTNVPVSVYPVSSTTWIESGTSSITWNTKPVAGTTVLANTTIANNTAQWYDLDLTAYIQSEKAAGRNVVSFVAKASANSSPFVTFNSKEAATNQPQLLLLTTQPRDVLFVVGSATLTAADTAIKTRLQNLGYTVTVKAAGSTTSTSIKSTDADGKALVVVSSTVTPANVGTKLKYVAVPVLNWEFDLADDFGMTNTVSGTDFGTTASQTQVAIVTPAHPMSAGLTGNVSVVTAASTLTWGKPNANADKIASLTADATKLVIYGYDAGKTMFGLEAPARRVAVYLSDTTAASLTTNGGQLFDAAAKWAGELNISPVISALTPNSGTAATTVVISGMNFGAVQGTSTVTFNGITAPVTSWSNTSINATAPAGVSTGSVVVIVNGISSNAVAFTVNAANGDSDGDGLADAWEMQYFGNLNQGANGDPDGDGVSNLQEYLQGRNPTKGAVSAPMNSVDLRVYTQLEP